MASFLPRATWCLVVLAASLSCGRDSDVLAPIAGISKEQFLERIKTVNAANVTDWHAALEAATGETLTRFQVFEMLPHFHPLWKDDVFQGAASKLYLERARAVPAEAIQGWRAAILRKNPDADDDQPLANALLRVVVIDELFDGKVFDNDRSKELLSRLE